jgi:hypothetical protein
MSLGKHGKGQLPAEVEKLRDQLLVWRQKRDRPGPLPAEIWNAAVPMAQQFGVCRISRAVGLDYSWLRRKVSMAMAEGRSADPAFVELPAGLMLPAPQGPGEAGGRPMGGWPMSSGSVIEVSSPAGAQMRICLEPGKHVDIAGLVTAFLGSGH